MRFLLFLLAMPAIAAIDGLSVIGTTSGQIVISYTAPSTASCKVEASTGSGYTPLAADVDATLFANQDRDTSRTSTQAYGRFRIVVLGRLGFHQGVEAVEQATNGYHLSRALIAGTQYYIRISDCGDGQTATTTARTGNINLGDSRGQALAVSSTETWRYKQVSTNKVINSEFADPYTGALIKNPPELLGFAYSQSTATAGDGYSPTGCNITSLSGSGVKGACRFLEATGTNWTATSGTLTDGITADDSNFVEYSGTSQDKIWFRLGPGKYPVNSTQGQQLAFQYLALSAKTSDATGEGGWLRACLTANGKTCTSPARRLNLTTTKAVYAVCSTDPCTKDNPGDLMWDVPPPGSVPLEGAKVYNVAGSLETIRFVGSNATGACNELYVGERFYAYGSQTNGISPYPLNITAKSCGSSPPQVTISPTSDIGLGSFDLTAAGTNGVTAWRNDGVDGYRYGFLIWKESTTSAATISIDLPLWRAASAPSWSLGFGSGGFGKRCQDVPTPDGYYLCMTGAEGNVIIGMKPLPGGGFDIKNYGITNFRGDTINAGLTNDYVYNIQNAGGNDSPWDDSVPGVFYAYFNSAAGCGPVIVKMTLSLATPAASDPDGSFPVGTRGRIVGLTGAVILTPCGSGASDFSLSTQRGRISSEWVDKGSMFGNCSIEAVQGLTIIEICKAGSQDSQGFVFAWDLGNRGVAGVDFVGTRGGNTQQAFAGFLVAANHYSRYCGVHTYQNPLTVDGAPFALVELGSKAPMGVTVDSSLSACDSRNTPGTCSPCPAVTLDGFNYSGKNWCSPINVSSSCASVSAPAGCTDGDPISGGSTEAPNLKWYQTAAVGDMFVRYIGDPAYPEILRIIQKNSQTQWVVIRGWGNQSSSSSNGIYAPKSFGGGLTWLTWCGGGDLNPLTTAPETPWGLAWYFGSDTDGSNPTYTLLSRFQNHGFHAGYYGAFPDYTVSRFNLSDPADNLLSRTQGSFVQLPVTFGNKAVLIDGPNVNSNCAGNACEKHPGANQLLGDTSYFYDLNPRMFHTSGTNAVALVAGKSYIYKYNGNQIFSPKHYDIEGYMGEFPLRRVDTLTDSVADTGKYCNAILVNDCFSGSTAGATYFVNEVFDTSFIALSTCRESQFGTQNGDACFGPSNGIDASITQWRVPSTNGISILNGSQTRAVSKEWRRYREAATENVKMDPTGSAMLTRALWYVLPPPFPGVDSRNRGTFSGIPVSIPNVPGGTDNVLIQFGYNTSFQCSRNRDNTCYAESATLSESTPFKFDHETLTGISCASSCTVTIPAQVNRVLYWRIVYRNSGGSVIARGPVNVQVIQ